MFSRLFHIRIEGVGALASTIQNSPNEQVGRLVSAQGEVTALPDHTTLNLGVESRAATVAEARFEQQEAGYRLSRNLSTSAVHWSGIKL